MGFALAASPALAGDTTYTRTQAVAKPSSSRSHASDGWTGMISLLSDVLPDAASSGPDSGGGGMPCMDADSPGEIVGFVLLLPVWLALCGSGYGIIYSYAHLAGGWADMEDMAARPWRLGVGFGVAAEWQPGLAEGASGSVHLEAVRNLSADKANGCQLRLQARAYGTWLHSDADYTRTVLVDGWPVGSEYDASEAYSRSGFPVSAEILWHPGELGFYLGGGGGALLIRESARATRTRSWQARAETLTETRDTWAPMLTAVLGRYGGQAGQAYWRFEMRYQAALLWPTHSGPVPGDNGWVAHSLGWDWAWLW